MTSLGQVALVTGAASGIGAAAAALLRATGLRVFATDLREAEGIHPHDVTDPAQWDRALAECVARHGRLDILVSNAGTADACPLADLTPGRFAAQGRVHAEAAFHGLGAAVAQFRRQGSPAVGAVVIVASIAGVKPIGRTAAYGVCKAAQLGLARSAAAQFAAAGDRIRVNAVAPGGTRTPMTEALYPPAYWEDAANFDAVPMKDYCRPEDIAEAILHAATEPSLNGAALAVDGGWMLSNRI